MIIRQFLSLVRAIDQLVAGKMISQLSYFGNKLNRSTITMLSWVTDGANFAPGYVLKNKVAIIRISIMAKWYAAHMRLPALNGWKRSVERD